MQKSIPHVKTKCLSQTNERIEEKREWFSGHHKKKGRAKFFAKRSILLDHVLLVFSFNYVVEVVSLNCLN